jgi:hypothetical protein
MGKVGNGLVDAQPVRGKMNAISCGKQQDQLTYSIELLKAFPLTVVAPDFLKGLA